MLVRARRARFFRHSETRSQQASLHKSAAPLRILPLPSSRSPVLNPHGRKPYTSTARLPPSRPSPSVLGHHDCPQRHQRHRAGPQGTLQQAQCNPTMSLPLCRTLSSSPPSRSVRATPTRSGMSCFPRAALVPRHANHGPQRPGLRRHPRCLPQRRPALQGRL